MGRIAERMDQIVLQVAEEAWARPLNNSGLWYHNDIRNNFYDAAYLFAAASDKRLSLTCERDEAVELAQTVFLNVLSLQDQVPESPTFGHWPLYLGDEPARAEKNTLPAELMGCLMVYWHDRYASVMDEPLANAFDQTIQILYQCSFYRELQRNFSHHEAKYLSLKLLLGYRFNDAELLASGRDDLQVTIERLQHEGMAEYGALPWFWHWVQSLTCAYACIEDQEIHALLDRLLELLWTYRAEHYLNGAWIGGRMRSLPVDLPRDQNTAFDYVQFGDFELPKPLLRVEFAGLLHYEVSEEVRQLALSREPRMLNYTITPAVSAVPLHQSVYRTQHAAVGGIEERVTEFDNEQHRWEVTLPLSEAEGANRLYLFSPGEGFHEGDPRHESNAGELMFHKQTVIGLYGEGAASNRIVGVLPKGDWLLRDDNRAYAELRHLYVGLFMLEKLSTAEFESYVSIDSVDQSTANGYVVEVIEKSVAAAYDIHTLADFAAYMDERQPNWHIAEGLLSVGYRTIDGEDLILSVEACGDVVRTINGHKR